AAELERRNLLKKKLSEWEFNPHQLNDDDLLECVFIIFDHVMQLDDLKDLGVSPEQLRRLLIAIRQSYYDTNPYHNFTHAVDVLQAMFHFLCQMDILPPLFSSKRRNIKVNQQRCRPNDLLTVTDAFALLLASIGHDVGHPGSNTPLAQVYNDKSVLESFHTMTLFNMMQKHGFKIYENNNGSIYNPKYNVNSILATDMSLHNDYVTKIKEEIKRFESLDTKFDTQPMARPYHIAANWSNVLIEEFRCQGDLERKLGLPILPLNDRNGKTTQSESQIGFIDYCAMPLFNRKTSPISAVQPARTTNHQFHQLPGNASYLLQMPNLPDGSEVDILSTTGASDSPLNSRHDTQRNTNWQRFSRNNQSLSNTVYASTYTSTDNISNQNDLSNNRPSISTICCCIQ
ncbi:10855_t:CDS:2, partial [Racocetra fulgida]